MEASTAISSIANHLGAYWSGMVDANQASVVFIWPDREKVYLSFELDSDQPQVDELVGAEQKATLVERALGHIYHL